jgi:hypothetical protein
MLLTATIAGALLTQQVSPRHDSVDSAVSKSKGTGWYTHYAGSATWDPKTVISFEGKVLGVIQSNRSVDLMVKLKNGGTAFVELGPKPYFDGQALRISSQDMVKVRGSKVMVNGESLVLCQELRHSGSRIAFRTQDGRPFWSLK